MATMKKSIPHRPAGLRARPQMSMTKEEFIAICDQIGLSIKEIAERLDINRATVHSYRTGHLKVTTVIALAMTALAQEVEKEREANRRRLKRYGYSEEEQENLLSVLPSGLAMAFITPQHGHDDEDDDKS